MNSLKELMDKLKEYALQYAAENGVTLNNNGFVSCLSPDHEDRNPSMHYWEENNIFYCFSCGFVADIFTLANILEGKPLTGPEFITENVFYLARRYGEEYTHLQSELTQAEIKKYTLLQTMKLFSEYVVQHRNSTYLNSRKITDETAKKLSIGSVESFNKCYDHLIKKGCSPQILQEIGIEKFKVNENKMIFIIKDSYKRPVSFVSREMKDVENNPKYINGNATDIFNKSKIFYLWSDIKKEFKPIQTLIIVEGYIDAVTAYQYGFRQIVAIGSASFTDDHIKIIESSNNIQDVAIALDNDKVGKARMNKIIDRLKEQKTSKEYKFAVCLSDKKDLDEIINNSLSENKQVQLSNIYELKSLFDFELSNIKEQYGNSLNESAIFDVFTKIIAKTKRAKTREEQAKELSKYLNNYSFETIFEEVKELRSGIEEMHKEEIKVKVSQAFEEIKNNPQHAKVIIEELNDSIENVNRKYEKKEASVFEEALDFFDNFEVEKKNKNLFQCNFGIPALDDLDINLGDIVSLGALPNVGKSTFFQKITRNVIQNNDNAVLIFASPDDPAEKIYGNLIAALSGLPREYCKNPYFHKKYGLESGFKNAQKFFEVYESYKGLVRNFIEKKKIIVLDVKNGIGEWRNLEGKLTRICQDKELVNKFKLLICDPVNKIEVTGISNENETISYLSQHIKKLCENLKILAFLNFELNKARNNSRLSQFQLSGSRRMNYDTNVLLFMYNPTRNLQQYVGTENETKMKWKIKDNFGRVFEQPILVTIQEKTKNGNEEMNGKPYFYMLNTFTSELTPIEVGSKQHYYYENIWQEEWTNLYHSYLPK